MSEFALGVEERIAQTRASLAEAREAEDDYLVEVLLGELESLVTIAYNNDLEIEGMHHMLAVETGAIPVVEESQPLKGQFSNAATIPPTADEPA
ncbi:hypothetical protein LWF01_06140 [Saxibacter everestensis]|uniref:Uncharacterized protein n=1 Tax=Saxibacter everestensis TaxID=2909229 RepID=A0ABY8QYA1_9MICO|nr:hypothetical protein LWF01_06140 [Brevibacteriaceae bacterium ZFBP1038]